MKVMSFLLAMTVIGCGVEPQSGTWSYDEQTPQGCGNGAQYLRDGDGLFTLENNGDGTFTVDAQDGGQIFDCALDGDDYDCPERVSRTYDLAALGLGEGTGSLHVSVRGEFSASNEATGMQTGRLECQGAGCALAASQLGTTFPCTVSVDFAASTD